MFFIKYFKAKKEAKLLVLKQLEERELAVKTAEDKLKREKIREKELAKLKEDAKILADEEEARLLEEEKKRKEDEPKYYIGIYKHDDGSPNKVCGNWKETKEEVDAEANTPLYRRQLGVHFYEYNTISRKFVSEIAEEHNWTIGKVLSIIYS